MARAKTPPPIARPDWEQARRALEGRDPAVTTFLTRCNEDEYLHWEDARFRKPKGMSDAAAWALLKLSRNPPQRLPLLDPAGRAFWLWQPNSHREIQHKVDRQTGAHMLAPGFADAAALLASRETVVLQSLREEAIASSQIEGAVTTRRVAEEMLRTGRRPKDTSERMIVNGYKTMERVRERRAEPLTQDLLSDLQRTITHQTLEHARDAGRLRTSDDVLVVDRATQEVVHRPPPAKLLKKRLAVMFAFANQPPDEKPWLHPLVRAAVLHFWVAYEHPFADGNGRTARAVFYWSMLHAGYELMEFLTISRFIHQARTQYYDAFRHVEQDGHDLTYFVAFQSKMVLRALDDLWKRVAVLKDKQRRVLELARTAAELNLRQRLLLEHALRHPEQLYTFQSHGNSHGISYPTARADLLDLEKRGYLVPVRLGKQHAFRPVEALEEKLRRGR